MSDLITLSPNCYRSLFFYCRSTLTAGDSALVMIGTFLGQCEFITLKHSIIKTEQVYFCCDEGEHKYIYLCIFLCKHTYFPNFVTVLFPNTAYR